MPRFAKGHVRHPHKDHMIALSHHRHRAMLRSALAVTPPSSWDSRAHGWVGPVQNQEQCGSCWDFSGTGMIDIAYNKAGIGGGPDTFVLSNEYMLSCCSNGKCNGDDNVTVLNWAKAHGLPLKSDYGAYGPYPDSQNIKIPACAWNSKMNMYKISDWGFAQGDADYGVASTPHIKSAIMQYGSVGAAIAFDDAAARYTSGVFTGSGSTEIDHDIILVGWDDSKGSGAWILRNSWGSDWGEDGYMWIEYGANLVGTEAVWCSV